MTESQNTGAGASDVRVTIDTAKLHLLRLIDPEVTLASVETWFVASSVVLATKPHHENHPRA